MRRPPGATSGAISAAKRTRTGPRTFAATTSNGRSPVRWTPGNVDLLHKSPRTKRISVPSPFFAAFSFAFSTASGSMSNPATSRNPSSFAAIARMPEPQPTSRKERSAFSTASSSMYSRQACVVACWPVPNAMPGSRISTRGAGEPAVFAAKPASSHSGTIARRGEITSVLKCLR